MESKVETYSHHIINTMWYCQLTRNADGKVTILLHDRLNPSNPRHPATDGEFRFNENDNRIVESVILFKPGVKSELLHVTNPKHVFSYGKFDDNH